MKKNSLIIFVILVSILTFSACNKATDVTEETTQNEQENVTKDESNVDIEAIAESYVNDILNENYENAYNNYTMNSKLKDAFTPDIMKAVMTQLTETYGSFIKTINSSQSQSGQYNIVSFACEFEKQFISLNVVFDTEKQIAGFNYTLIDNPSGASTEESNVPDSITEYEVAVGEEGWSLPGTLSIPKGEGPFPVVVLVHGSGPSDRDETIGPNKPFRDIAWGLSTRGVAVLRYEKRTKHYAVKLKNVTDFTVKEETINDAISAVQFLKGHNQIDPNNIYVLGHSLGGYLVPRIVNEDKDIAGCIILAGNTRPLEDLMLEQYEYLYSLDSNVDDEETANLDFIKSCVQNIKDPNLSTNTDPAKLFSIYAPYWLDLRNYNPVEMAKQLQQRILIMQGLRDYQVTEADLKNWQEALENKENVTFKTYEKLNHLFLEGEGTPNPNEYLIEGHIPNEVIEDLINWIEK